MLSGQKPSLKPAELALEDRDRLATAGKSRTWRAVNLKLWSQSPRASKDGWRRVSVKIQLVVASDALWFAGNWSPLLRALECTLWVEAR